MSGSKKALFWLFLVGLLVLAASAGSSPAYASPDPASTFTYYPSGYNLLGSTAYVSGSLSDLVSDNGVYMTFRSYASSYATSIKAMFSYGEGTVTTPRYRVWDGTSWGTEASASNTASTVQWVVLKSGPERDEKTLGTLASTGAIHAQVWNGSSWSAAQVLGSGVGTTNDAYRGFDIAYEQTSGRAIVVFVPSTTAVDPQYVIWNGSSWTAPATIDIPTAGVVYWVKLASRPLSNQIALMTLDANADIAGIIWDGSAWGNARTLTATASTATRECFGVEYEQQSGYAMFVWGEVATDLYYWRWNGTGWLGTTQTLLDLPAQGGVSNWVSLKADPNSNRLMLGVQDAGRNLNTREWSGTAWDTATEHPEHDPTVENVGSRSFDVEYETFSGHTGHAILVWGDGSTASWKHWTPTTGASGWSAATVLTGSDDTAVTQLRRSKDGTIFAAILDDPTSATDDLVEYRWNGNAWSSRLVIEDTPSMTAQPMMEPFMVAPDAHQIPAEYTMEVEFTGSSNTDYWNQLAWTIDSAWTTDNVTVTLQLYNYTLGSYPASGNGYTLYNSSASPNTDETKNQTITTNPAHFRDSLGNWKVKVKGVKSTTAQFDFKADLVKFEVTVGDTTPPVWSNTGTNNTIVGEPTLFYVKWTDNIGLSGFIFGTNNTGTWSNDTWTPMSGTTDWSNVTETLNSTGGMVVEWRIWANDTYDNWNDTGTLSLKTTQPPVASFTYSPSTPYTGETVVFNASSSYDPDDYIVGYAWNFGDGTNGTGETTTHTYADNGTYTVTLNVTDSDGLSDTTSADITVLNRPPVAAFTESATTVLTGEAIYFNASDSYDPDGYIVSYLWDFGDGTNATGVTVEHAYVDDGVYSVTLTVTDDDGTTDTTASTKTILNRPPVASFTESAETIYTDDLIYFNASESHDPDGVVVSYSWDFGDGTNGTGVTAEHAYADNGTYTVTLTVTDDDGATATAAAAKTVLNRAPVASFTESATVVFTGEVITFNASGSYDPDGIIVSYFWTFGDGTNTTGVIAAHSYTNAGTYTVTLIITDEDGATASATANKTVLNQPPIASFTESATTVYTGVVIDFDASSSYDPDGVIVSYFWDFGDGTNATGVAVSHAYSDNGVYTVNLTVTDSDGATATATATKTILNRPPVAAFTESAETVYIGEAIIFNASSSYDPDGIIMTYFWDFGDGTNATGVIVSHAYAINGTFTVTLTVTDDDGASNSSSSIKTVLWNEHPVALFTESAETVYTGEIIAFNASASYDPDGTIASYFWAFGDGTNATGVVVEHAYVDDGIYTVTLTVTDDHGATGSTSSIKAVLNRPPMASFTESAETVLTGEIIYFNASASSDPDGMIVSYFWTFGDGTNATGVTVEHAYADNGVYTVTLTVTDDDGATATISAAKTVLNRPPVASFTESATTVYTGEVIYFNATSSYDPDGTIISYFWAFGDGTNASGATVNHAYGDNGVYTVALTVTDDDGATATSTATKTVLNRPPVASFTESATTVYKGEIIHFDASASYDPDGSVVGYFWTFGDGTNATGMTVDHAYADDGNYTVTLTVTDDDGASASTSAAKTVLNRPPVASFTESAETVYTGEAITFNASGSSDPDGVILNYFWDFGDGINATGITVDHAYADDGTYTVTLTVTDDDGATGTATSIKAVLNRAPVAVFTESAETVSTGEAVTFNATDSYDQDGVIVNYFWDFGDGTNASGVVMDHSYADNGTYTVTLAVTDDDGATDTATSTKYVLNRPPVAHFIESTETVYTGEVIAFNASGSYDPDGYIVSYFWSFGDGTNATSVVVDHAYSDDGIYTVTLTLTDDDGATASTSATKTVLNKAPVASFTESATTAYTGEVISFNASSSYDSDGVIDSYFWDFGDGTNATGVTVGHSYADDGNYTVTLTVMDDDGATGTETAVKTVLNRSPVAVFTESAETVYTSEVIYFNASDSYDPDGVVVIYFWDFGDGANATGIAVDHAYVDNGTYTVTLTVSDDDGATDSATATKTVLNRPPVASFTESTETVYTGESIMFNASSSYDPDGTIMGYTWNFGDGNVTTVTDPIITHAYADNGTYIVTLTVTDDDGATATSSATKTVLNRPPIAIFSESAETVVVGQPIYLNASQSYDPDGSIVSYYWDFGDGTNATGVTTEHAYSDNGIYIVTLTVSDNDGATASAGATKTVAITPPVAVFTESAETVYTGEVITFNASGSYDSDGSIVSYFWTFGDGTNATGITVEHAYADNGIYTVTLTVTDDDGATGTATSTKTVLNRAPIATFTESAETVLTDEPIYFNASQSYDPDGVLVSYFWDFGDGSNATGVVVNHAYLDDGAYVVTLTVADDDGATASSSFTKTVLNRPPIAIFTESAESVYTGEMIAFNASASYDIDGVVVSYLWNFGDGTNATGVVVDHAYADNGVYTVALTVTDNDGATATASAVKTVGNRPPIASFTESATTVFTNEVIYFNASGSYDTDGTIVSYFWTFGDGTNATGITVNHTYADNGVYTVTLTVTDDDGVTGTTTATKSVLNRPPVASFSESATTVLTGETIFFNASASYDPDGWIVSYFWDFGDGTNATGLTASHAYADNGTYVVALTVTDNDGATASTTATKTVLNRPPVASFTESATTVLTGEAIRFNASASYDLDGSIVSFFWTFGDGTNATGMAVDHAYADDGSYNVILTVRDNDGATATATAAKTVLNRPPVASFTESATTVLTGEVIYFNASSSYDPDGSIISYFWTFGDGTNATGTTVDHAYVENGVYNVTLTVTDNDSSTATTAATKTVLNRPPVASFTESTTSVLTGEVIAFNASNSYDPDGTIVSYTWNFGDGNITAVTSPLITHSYVDNGTYTVTLTVTDNDGATGSANAIKTVSNRAPAAVFTESATTVYTQETITFNASASYDLDGSIMSYTWNFGDGNITTVAGPIITHAYADNGTYTVTLTVTDDDGATSSSSSVKTVLNRPPVATFTESATTMFTGEVVAFNASESHDQDGAIVSYFWAFGDGTNATGVTVTHAYPENGVYTVTLTVTDNDGEAGTATAVKTVLNRLPVASFTESATTVYTGVAIRFNASASYDPDGSIVNFLWAFGDGTNATGVVVDHAYSDNGIYTVTLTVTDNDGGTATANAAKTVLNRAPVASFTESATTVPTGEVIYFNASASYDLDGTILSYTWAFGDGTSATGVLASHAYANSGVYVVTLTVTDDDGATGSISSTKTVLKSPVASFTYSPSVFRANETVTFDASASEPGFNGTHDVPIANYTWDFGDGNTTTVSVPVIGHVYVVEGTYTVNLTVVCEDDPVLIQRGLTTDSAWQSLTVYLVTPHGPTASFAYSPLAPLAGEAVTFNASSSEPGWNGSAPVPIVTYTWGFGDGNVTTVTKPVVYHAYASNGTYTVNLTVVCEDDPVLIREGLTSDSTWQDVTVYLKRVSVKPPSIVDVYQVNDYFRVEVYVEDMTDLYCWEVGVAWDPTVLECTAFTEGPFLKTGGTTTMLAGGVNNAAGRIDPPYSCTLLYPAEVGVSGSGTLAYVDFRVRGYGETWINLTVTLYDSSFSIIDAGVQPGWFQLTLPPPRAPKASFTYSPPIVNRAATFDASASRPGFNGTHDVSIANYTWDFGDGTGVTTVTDPVILHTYTLAESYTVSLTVTCEDDPVLVFEGLTRDTATADVVVREHPLVYVKPPSIVDLYVAGETFTVEVYVEGITDLYSWSIGMSWDPAVLNCTGFREGPFLKTEGGTLLVKGTINNAAGEIRPPYSCTLLYPVEVGVNGSGTLAYVDFRVRGYGETWLNLTAETEMLDSMTPYPNVILVDLEPGWFRLSPPPEHDIDVTGMQAPDSIGTGVSTLINATVRNRGLGNESNVYVWFMVNDILTDTATIPYLGSGAGVGVSFPWTAPGKAGAYNLTVYAVPVPGEETTTNNYVYQFVTVKLLPVARFTYLPTSPVVGEAVTFNATASYDPDGTIVRYAWDFGDNTNATGVTASHAYFPAGIYTVTLTVTDDRGDSNTASADVTVTVAGVTLDVEVDVGSIHFRNETAEFFVLVSRLGEPVDADINATLYYDNGTVHRDLTASVERIATGLYRVPYTLSPDAIKGTYVLVVKAEYLTLKGISLRSFLLDPPAVETSLVACAGGSRTAVEDVAVSLSANGSIGAVVGWEWDFGDGTGGAGVTATHTYAEPGVYHVTLTVKDATGRSATDTVSITVLDVTAPRADAGPDQTVNQYTLVKLDGSGSVDNAGVVEYTWTFTDGTPQTLTGINPNYAFVTPGTYIVTLNVTDAAGNRATGTVVITVLDVTNPLANAGPDRAVGEDTLVTFDGSGSLDNVDVVSYAWTFTDATSHTLTGVSPTYNFTTPGVYVVTLNVTDAAGNWAMDTVVITVLDVTPPVADAGNDQTASRYTTVSFDASGSTDNVGLVSYEWDFGDGTQGAGVTETHAYAEIGTYNITLRVRDAMGNVDTDSIIVTVLDRGVPSVTAFSWWILGLVAAVGIVAATAYLIKARKPT